MSSTLRIAVVPPRYGEEVLGGAETALREMAEGLVARGHDVQVLTTCARDHFTWDNVLSPGPTEVNGVPVLRFPTVMSHNRAERDRLEALIMSGGVLTLEQQQRWANGLFRVPDLFHHLLDHGDVFDVLIFAPYLFWTTFACSQLMPRRSALLACLHDEPFSRLDIFRPLFTALGDVWFMSEPEAELAKDIVGSPPPRSALTGCGVRTPSHYDPEGFRQRHGIAGRFLLYAGRREGAKGWETLLEQFERATVRGRLPFSLVTCGGGRVDPPPQIADRVIDVGFLTEQEKVNAFAAADGYLQPSRLEAFSRTVMEAWLAGTPVVANGAGRVVSWHCSRSGAGLTYDDEYELQECLSFIADCPGEAAQLASAGRAYVLDNYTWDRVLDTVEGRLQWWHR